ncbi:hypothetical protein ACWEFJ_04835 [Actinosynnema sp. NPDC004786]
MPTSRPTTTTTPETGTGWRTVTVTVDHGGRVSLPAEPAAPGLVIVPAHHQTSPRWTGGYRLVHLPSGLTVGPSPLSLVYTRELAHLLARGGDWTRPGDRVRADTTLRHHAVEVLYDLALARTNGLPLWWARPSWQRLPPPWLIDTPHPTTGDGPWLATNWTEVVRLAEYTAAGGWAPIPDDAVVRRGEHTEWQLVCAAPACGTTPGDPDRPPTVLTDWDDDIGDTYPMRHTRRAPLITHAREQHWRDHTRPNGEQHWLCPPCADEYPRDHDQPPQEPVAPGT